MIKLIRALFNRKPDEEVNEEGKDYIDWMLLEGKTWGSLTNSELVEMRENMSTCSCHYIDLVTEISRRLNKGV